MRRKRPVLFALSFVTALLALAPSAFATTYGGQGIYGPTNDKDITDTMFIIMGLILVIIVVYIFLQGWRATLIPLLAVPVSVMLHWPAVNTSHDGVTFPLAVDAEMFRNTPC